MQTCPLPKDEFGLVPRTFPSAPRLWTSPEKLRRARRLLNEASWGPVARRRLLQRVEQTSVPNALSVPQADAARNVALLQDAVYCAVAGHLLEQPACFVPARRIMLAIAAAYPQWPMGPENLKATADSIAENQFVVDLSALYDLLAAVGLEDEEDRILRDLLHQTRTVLDAEPHRDCGNHNSSSLYARFCLGMALGNHEILGEAFYGCVDQEGRRRYGFVHHFQHDFLADGFWFERAIGYHVCMLYYVAHMADSLENVGIDLWHAAFPAQTVPDELDRHPLCGPPGNRCVRAPFDALVYAAFEHLDVSFVHDSRLENLSGLPHSWGVTWALACRGWQDPRHLWLYDQAEKAVPPDKRVWPNLPRCLQQDAYFPQLLRLPDLDTGAGAFDWDEDATIGQTGEHQAGSSLFPHTGFAVLRVPADGGRRAVAMNWGPHVVGHQSPACLHLDLHDGTRPVTAVPATDGYADPRHLSWFRTTIAHNTVTVDQTPMIPYHLPTESIWEAERFHQARTDSLLLQWEPQPGRPLLRVINENVYPGIRLDRTLLLTADFLLDIFQAQALDDRPHQFDWAVHLYGERPDWPGASSAGAGNGRGYEHFSRVRTCSIPEGCQHLDWTLDGQPRRALIRVPEGGERLLADTPVVEGSAWPVAARVPPGPRFAVLQRVCGQSACFTSLWTFDDAIPEQLKIEQHPDHLRVDWQLNGREQTLLLPVPTAYTH